MSVRRRDWVIGLALAPAALSPLSAEQQTTAPQPPAAPDRLQKNINSIRETSTKLQQMNVPIDLEPAFTFKP